MDKTDAPRTRPDPPPSQRVHGLPEPSCLEALAYWQHPFTDILDYVRSLWHEDRGEIEVDPYVFGRSAFSRTMTLEPGGDPGNEDIITALSMNDEFWLLYWHSSYRDGRHIFYVPEARVYAES